MRINYEKLKDSTKQFAWVEDYWSGFSPTLSYQEQLQVLRRQADSLEYVERGWKEGKIAMLFNIPDRAGMIYLLATESVEERTEFLRSSETHARMTPEQRVVRPMIGWDVAKDAFLQMIARLNVRASYERNGHKQPHELELDAEATQWRVSGKLKPLFERLQ